VFRTLLIVLLVTLIARCCPFQMLRFETVNLVTYVTGSIGSWRTHPAVAAPADADLVEHAVGVGLEVEARRQQAAEGGRAKPRATPHRPRPIHLLQGQQVSQVAESAPDNIDKSFISVAAESHPLPVHVGVEAEHHDHKDAKLYERLPATNSKSVMQSA